MNLSFASNEITCNTITPDHFPAPFQAVIWRNWNLVDPARLANVLGCTIEELASAAADLGLTTDDDADYQIWQERGYQTIIRQNWHLLPLEQLLQLLAWNEEKLEFILKEDDFLWNKLGKCKPVVPTVELYELCEEEQVRTAKLRECYRDYKRKLSPPLTKPFDFLNKPLNITPDCKPQDDNLRMIYSYSALYGDPLLEGIDKIYPDKILDEYAAAGVNALWMQAVLYTLIPWFGESHLSKNYQKRLLNLRSLAQRMAQRGIRLFLYLNEPRAMPDWVFQKCCPDSWRGAKQRMETYSLCTSNPEVLQALSNAIEKLFSEVPELAGFFTITMSENATNCWSHTLFAPPTNCQRCLPRGPAVVIAEVVGALAEGAWRAKPSAEIIAWNWGWEDKWDEQVVELLPQRVKLMCVSETGVETDADGINGAVWDYSISKVGPGAWARRLWSKARSRGMDIMAKVQLNNTWECSAVPYLPTPGLVERHLQNLRDLGIKDFLLSWTLGGYPGGNIRLLAHSSEELTAIDFGAGAPLIKAAYDFFDQGFSYFPFNMVSQLYFAPQNFGPLNQLFFSPTGNRATMIGFPYDDLHSWTGRGHFPEDVLENKYRQMSELWQQGLLQLKAAEHLIPGNSRERYNDLFSVAEASYCHFRSSYLQIAFVRRRQEGLAAVKHLLEEEIELAVRLLNVVRSDSRIGFEASNHYYYTENTLMEKIFNCKSLLEGNGER